MDTTSNAIADAGAHDLEIHASAHEDSVRDLIGEILAQELPITKARQLLVAEFERRYVAHALARHGGNVTQAAAASGIARRYFNILRARRRQP